jgi:hypothetical protein
MLTSRAAVDRERALRALLATDRLASFEGALQLLRDLTRAEARREAMPGTAAPGSLAKQAAAVLRLAARILKHDARRREHEIDRESAWFMLFDIWLEDEAGLIQDFEEFAADAATLPADRRLLVRLACDELADLPIVFPVGEAADVRRIVLRAARGRLESLIATLLACDGDQGAPAVAEGRVIRRHLETAFLRHPTEKAFHAVKQAVPPDLWASVRARLLGHLQKHQRDPSLVFKLYWNEGLFVDADGLVVTQPVDPDLLATAAGKLKEHDPIVAAGWLLIAACRLADSFPRSRWGDVVRHLVAVRDLTGGARRAEFDRVLRTFRFRHAQSPDLLHRLSEVGL